MIPYRKIIIITFLLLIHINHVHCQELKVTDFTCLTQDLSARTRLRTDMNGDPCALIKVQIPGLNNINFEGWIIDQSYTPGEYAVYVPAGTQKIIIKHTDFLPLEYIFPLKIEGKTTYRLTLQLPKEKAQNKTIVHLMTNVKKATLQFGEHQYVTENAQFSFSVAQGDYPIKITPNENAFLPYEGTISVAEEASYQEFVCNLQSLSHYNVLYTSEPQSIIFVDGNVVPKNRQNTFSVSSGLHDVEIRLGNDERWFRQMQIYGVTENLTVDMSLSGSVTFTGPLHSTFKISAINGAIKPSRNTATTGETIRLLGDYKITVSRPGYKSRTIVLSVGVGDIIDNYSVELDCKANNYEYQTQYAKAFREYNKMASRNDEYAYYKLGEYYYVGKFVDCNILKAIENWRLSAQLGYTKAMMRLSDTTFGEKEKVMWLKTAAEAGETEAQLKLAKIYCNPPYNDYETAFSLLSKACLHNPYANYELGELYYWGNGVAKNVQIAKNYYEKGSCAGDKRCDERLADYIYDSGDIDKACSLYLKLPKPSSLTRLKIAIWFYEKDMYTEAGRQLLLIDLSEIDNTADLGRMFHKVADQIYNLNKTMSCNLHEIALNQLNYKYKDAYYHLGVYYEREWKNGSKAFYYYFEGANMKDAKSMCRLGYCYETGLGTRKDYKEAAKWYNEAIIAGNVQAYRYLGTLYINGHGVTKNEQMAEKLWLQGAEAKDKGAIKQLVQFYKYKHKQKEANSWSIKLAQMP